MLAQDKPNLSTFAENQLIRIVSVTSYTQEVQTGAE